MLHCWQPMRVRNAVKLLCDACRRSRLRITRDKYIYVVNCGKNPRVRARYDGSSSLLCAWTRRVAHPAPRSVCLQHNQRSKWPGMHTAAEGMETEVQSCGHKGPHYVGGQDLRAGLQLPALLPSR